MTNLEMRKSINQCVKTAKKLFRETMPKEEKIIVINEGLPYVGVYAGENEYFFQGQEANELLSEAENTSNKFKVSIENAIIWMAQGW